jgi:glycine dehydrogenase subunit 1
MSFVSITAAEREDMLRTIGVDSVRDLFADIPPSICHTCLPLAGQGMTEIEADARLAEMAGGNRRFASFAGAGSYVHHVPPVVDQLALRSEFYTAYTPYQAEISQGTLTAFLNFRP